MRRRTTGMTRLSWASTWNVSRDGQVAPNDRSGAVSATVALPRRCHCAEVVAVEAGTAAGVAGRADLVDPHEEGIAVAVEGDGVDVLDVPRRVALAPVLAPAAGPEGHPPLGKGPPQRLVVHPAEHEHLAGVVLLDDRGDQAAVVALEARGNGGVEGRRRVGGHGAILPCAAAAPRAVSAGPSVSDPAATPRRRARRRRRPRPRRGRGALPARQCALRRPRRPRRQPPLWRGGGRSRSRSGPGSALPGPAAGAPPWRGRRRRLPRPARAGRGRRGRPGPGPRAVSPPPTGTPRVDRRRCRALGAGPRARRRARARSAPAARRRHSPRGGRSGCSPAATRRTGSPPAGRAPRARAGRRT